MPVVFQVCQKTEEMSVLEQQLNASPVRHLTGWKAIRPLEDAFLVI